jgi:hypothetical protein
MKAIVIRGVGGPEVLELREVSTPEPRGDQIRVRVRACGLNRADLLQTSPESSVIYNPEGKISQEKLENPAGFWNNVEENMFSLFQNKGAFE